MSKLMEDTLKLGRTSSRIFHIESIFDSLLELWAWAWLAREFDLARRVNVTTSDKRSRAVGGGGARVLLSGSVLGGPRVFGGEASGGPSALGVGTSTG